MILPFNNWLKLNEQQATFNFEEKPDYSKISKKFIDFDSDEIENLDPEDGEYTYLKAMVSTEDDEITVFLIKMDDPSKGYQITIEDPNRGQDAHKTIGYFNSLEDAEYSYSQIRKNGL